MHMNSSEFRKWPNKAITLLGMSGVGKTTLANHLPKNNWFHFSGDYRIGTKYLEEPILDNIKRQAMQVDFLRELLRSDSIYIASNVTVENLSPISTFLGKVGRSDLGGLPLEEFLRRQRLHREAEIQAMKDVPEFISKAREIYGYEHFINDAGGSVCELDDNEMMAALSNNTLILYLRPDQDMEQELIKRAVSNPKPLYYREDFFQAQLASYLEEHSLTGPNEIDPDNFVQWIFPRLSAHRKPRYEALTAEHGYAVDAAHICSLRDEQDINELICETLDRN
jgi:hypothetical protein